MKKDTFVKVTTEFLEGFEKEVRTDERSKIQSRIIDEGGYIGLEYVLGFLSRIIDLNKNAIKKYLYECNILDMVDKKYIPKTRSKLINNVICIDKDIIKDLINLNIFVELIENNNLDTEVTKHKDNKNTYCMISYDMHKAENQKNDKKFDRIKKIISITNNVDR